MPILILIYDRVEILLLGHHITQKYQHQQFVESLAELISANVITDEGIRVGSESSAKLSQIVGVEEYFLYNFNLKLILPPIPLVKLPHE